MKRAAPFLLFLALAAFHVAGAGGALVPYRDTGEMVAAAHTLGVAHPPGYPLYVLMGKAAQGLPLGNPAYRLNVLSALAAALAGLMVYFALGGNGSFPALAGAGVWAGSPIFRELSSVSEMYTLGLLAAAAVIVLARRTAEGPSGPAAERAWALAGFLLGLGAGLRTDLLLLAPALIFLWWRTGRPLRAAAAAAAFFLLGLSVFLYLPLRSARQPWLDWNDPETPARLFASLLRRSHGGTLDLLSKSYRPGENFLSEMALYLKNTAAAFSWAGLPLALAGIAVWRRRAPAFLGFAALVFAAFGPLFIYLANMPPNPHAVAVVEAHYLVSQLAVLLAAGEGLALLSSRVRGPLARRTLAAVVLGLVAVNAWAHAERGSKRWNLYGRDYAANALRAGLPGSIAVFRNDVPLFALWERTLVSGFRADVTPVAQGLAASPWYREMLRRQPSPAAVLPLKDAGGWRSFAASNAGRPLWAGGDADLPAGIDPLPWGLVLYISTAGAAFPAVDPFPDFAVLRGVRRQTEAPDFFASAILSEYGKASLRAATALLRRDEIPEAERRLLAARLFDPELPAAPFSLGYLYLRRGEWDRAGAAYSTAAGLNEELRRRARYYKSLPEVVEGLEREAAEAWVHRGVLAEKRGNLEAARDSYAQAVRLHPRSAQAHYNWAVTYWNRDWDRAAAHLREAAALEPSNPQFRRFYERAEAFRRRIRPATAEKRR